MVLDTQHLVMTLVLFYQFVKKYFQRDLLLIINMLIDMI